MKHIAIVDDDVYIGDMLQEVLERAGYAVSRASPAGRPCRSCGASR